MIDALKAPRTVVQLAAATRCDRASLVRLVRVLADLGLVTVSVATDGAEPVVIRADRGAVLSRGHASRLRELALLHTSLPHLASWERLADAVRTGEAVFESVNGIGWWDFLAANSDEAAIFDAAMAGRGSDQPLPSARAATLPASATSWTSAGDAAPCSPRPCPPAPG